MHSLVPFDLADTERSIGERFRRVAERHAGRVAVRGEGRDTTYATLDAVADRFASALNAKPASAPVALLVGPRRLAMAAFIGAARAGRLCVPLDPTDPPDRLAMILDDAGAGTILADAPSLSLASRLAGKGRAVLDASVIEASRAAPPPPAGVSPDALCCILYTSGSSGAPKGVVRNHRCMLHYCMAYTNALRIAADDRLALLFSPSFGVGLNSALCALLNGATLLPWDLAGRGVQGLADWIREERITVYHSVPTVFRQLLAGLRSGEGFPSVRVVVLAGETVLRSDRERFAAHFPPPCLFVNSMGSTEVTVACQFVMDHETPFDGPVVPVGYPAQDMLVDVVDEEGRALRQGEVGEIAVTSRYLSSGYWRRPDLTRCCFVPSPDGRSVTFRTGDVGRFDSSGRLIHLGRKDDQIKVRGLRVEPAEVESALSRHPAVRETAVVAAGETGDVRLTAYVRAGAPAPSAAELRAFLADRLPRPMVPARFVFVDRLPLTVTGKVDRRALSALAAREASAAPYVAPSGAVELLVASAWEEVLGVPRVGAQDDFLELGGDSLKASRVLSRLAAALGVAVPLSDFLRAPTVAALARAVARSQQATQPVSDIGPC